MKYLKYLWYVLRHKWYVFVECCKMGIPWRGVVHDMSKLRPSEFFPYAQFFYGKGSVGRRARDKTGYYKPTDTGDATFDSAWFLHQKRNDHHWQYWVLPDDADPSWNLQAPQPEACPLFLCKDGERVAVIENDAHYAVALEIGERVRHPAKVLPMSEAARKEMLCDWRGAGRAQGWGDNTVIWYAKNKDKMSFHPDTRAWIEAQRGVLK